MRQGIHKAVILLLMLLLFVAGCGITDSNQPSGMNPEPPVIETKPGSGSNGTTEQGEKPAPDKKPVGEPVKPGEPEDPAAAQLEKLSVEQKIGQLVIVGMEGTTVDDMSIRMLEKYHVGGFIFFRDNIQSTAQAVKLFNDLKKANESNPLPLWLSLDEEGGRVTRLPDELVKIPASGVIGKSKNPKLAEEVGRQIGRRLSGYGLNMDFAPVLDVNSNPRNPVIGDRAFGSTADQVSRMGLAAMKGIAGAGVVPVVKHFPGHGDTAMDSHLGLPVIKHDKTRLNQVELAPFRDAIEAGADVVMVGHLLMEKIDPDTPASFSKPVITGLLREELGFEGVVITDDMTMGAVAQSEKGIGEAAIQSVLAGTNIVLVGHDYGLEEEVLKSLSEAVRSGRIPAKLLDERVLPILRLKQKYHLEDNPAHQPDIEALNKESREILKKFK